MSYVKNYVHCIWGTKWRYHYLNESNTKDIMIHIRQYAHEKEIWIDYINGYQNHLHCLIALGPHQSLGEVINQLKGESSHWINQHYKMDRKFCWAVDYYAASVSLKVVPLVRKYIQNQKAHHQHKSWAQEENDFQNLISHPGLQAGD